MKRWISAVLVLTAGLGALLWYALSDPEQPPQQSFRAPPAVEVAPVTTGTVERRVDAVGTLRANESVVLRPEIAGRISAIHFAEGERVEAGAPLISLDDSLYEAEAQEKRANLRIAELDFERSDELVGKNAAPEEARDRALATLQAAEAALALSQARLDKMTLLAPFDGVVGLRHVSSGDFISAGQDLVNVVELDPIKVDFRVGEVYLPQVAAGQEIEIQVDAYPAQRFTGTVYAIEPLIDVDGRSVLVRARLPNPDLALRPGLFSRVSLIVTRAAEALLVPEDAIVPRDDRQFVYRVDGNRALLTEVALGTRREAMVEIVRGVSADDEVVTAGQLKLRDGIEIRPMPAGDAPASMGS